MPWSVGDVDSHKKGLSTEQKKKWVSVANGILKDCLAKGGTDATCAPKAIRIANSKFSEEPMKKETTKINKSALCFTDITAFAKSEPAKEGEERGLQMVAYSGKVIKDHWYWGDLVIDTAGMKFSKKQTPILQDHSTDRKIGFGTFFVNENHEIVPKETKFVDTDYAKDFIKLSDQGFPFEASIYARPSKIQRLDKNEETEVNGFLLKGPSTVWRESVLKECSIVTFGADSNTKSAAMSENEEVVMEVEEVKKIINKEEVNMDLAKLKAEFPDLYAEILALGKAEAEVAFAEVKTGLEAQIQTLTADKERLTADNKDINTRVLSLEKSAILMKEMGIKASADAVVAERVKTANVPERLIPKIRKQLNHESFIKDEQLDVAAFSAAVDAELKDWMPVEGEESTILGMSFGKTEGADLGNEDAMVGRMLGHVGQTK